MLKVVFLDGAETSATFENLKENVVKLIGQNVNNLSGFFVYSSKGIKIGDYSAYQTKYNLFSAIENGIILSTGEVEKEPTPEPEAPMPIELTLEEIKNQKIAKMNEAQQFVIQSGIDVPLSGGVTEHFALSDHDQISLMGLQSEVDKGSEAIPWHNSNALEHCKYYSNADMSMIVKKALAAVTFHVTYYRDLRIYINSLENKDEVKEIGYGIKIPIIYCSEVLKDIYALMEENI